MARVTKINVGGTNYDIAHEGELKNSGFEVVTELPTTGLFEGRQVFFQNRVWVYSNGWVSPNDPVSFLTGVTLQSSTEALTAAARYIELSNFQLAQVPELLNKSLFISNNENCVKKSDRLYELIDNETGAVTVKTGIVQPILGQTLRYTAINPSYGLNELDNKTKSNNGSTHIAYCVSIPQSLRYEKAIYKIEYYIYTNATGNGDVNDRDNYVWKTVFDKELSQKTQIIYLPLHSIYYTYLGQPSYTYVYNIRVSVTPTTKNNAYNISIKDIDIKYFSSNHKPLIYANMLINYDAVIEPTQTSETFKSIPWILQYLTQGVNWLKANNVRLSAYNTKVATLEQADSDNNANVQSVKEELLGIINEVSGGLAAVARSGSYNDLTDTPTLAPVATSGDYNDLSNLPTIPSSFADLNGNIDANNQISDLSIANGKLANSSMSLNDTTVNLGDTAILPWYLDYNEVDYPARIREHWLQIYRNGVWANLMYLGDILPTQVGQITSLDNLDWYNEQVSEYEVDSNTTISILNGTTLPATVLMNCLAEQLTLNLYPISGKQYGKGSLDSLISDLQGKGFAVFVENDLDAIIGSGSDYLVRIKISKVPTYKAIIECYVAR